MQKCVGNAKYLVMNDNLHCFKLVMEFFLLHYNMVTIEMTTTNRTPIGAYSIIDTSVYVVISSPRHAKSVICKELLENNLYLVTATVVLVRCHIAI